MATLAKWLLLASVAVPMYGQLSPAQIERHAKEAQEAQARQDFKTSIKEYEILAHAMPQSAELFSNLGVAYYFDQQFQKCIDASHKAIALKPDLEAPHLFLGLSMYHLSDYDGATPELEKALHLNSSDVLAHIWLGYTYVAQSHYDRALGEFRVASELQPNNVDAWYALGQTYLEIGKERTQQLLHAAPDSGRVWQLAAEQFEMSRESKKTSQALDEARHRRPDIIQPGANNGSEEDALYYQARDAEQAAQDAFQNVVRLAPDSTRAHQIAAESFFVQQQFDQALTEYRAVLRKDATLPGIHLQTSNVLMIKGQFGQALEECRAEEALQPLSSQVQVSLGRILLAMGRDSEAAAALNKGLKLNHPPIEAYLLLAKVKLRSDQAKEAIPLLERYISIRPENSTAYYLLSRAYRVTGETDNMRKALAMYQRTSKDVKERNMAQSELSQIGSDRASQRIREMDDAGNDANPIPQ